MDDARMAVENEGEGKREKLRGERIAAPWTPMVDRT